MMQTAIFAQTLPVQQDISQFNFFAKSDMLFAK